MAQPQGPLAMGQPYYPASTFGIPQHHLLGLGQAQYTDSGLGQAQYTDSGLGQGHYTDSDLRLAQYLTSAQSQGQLYNGQMVLPTLPGALPPLDQRIFGGNLMSGQANNAVFPTHPTINELYTSLSQLPPMRASISLQNLHQVGGSGVITVS